MHLKVSSIGRMLEVDANAQEQEGEERVPMDPEMGPKEPATK